MVVTKIGKSWKTRWLAVGLVWLAAACGESDGPGVGFDGGATNGGGVDTGQGTTAPMPGMGMMPDLGAGPDASTGGTTTGASTTSQTGVVPSDAGAAPSTTGGTGTSGATTSAPVDADAGGDAEPNPADAGGGTDAGLADAGDPSGGMDATSVCAGGTVGMDSENTRTMSLFGSRNLAYVIHEVDAPNHIVSFKTTMIVPEPPEPRGTLFIWPGLQNRGGMDPGRVGNGVLQPVLTWGPSCSREASSNYDTWRIAAMYVNISTSAAGPTGCAGGDGMDAPVGDRLFIDMSVDGTEWTQTVTNLRNMETVDFTIDLQGQEQHWAIWDVEVPTRTMPAADSIFEDSVVTYAQPVTSCQPGIMSEGDYFSAPVLSPDGLHCCFDEVILKKRD